jgi:molybdate transport system substrate-binding protein
MPSRSVTRSPKIYFLLFGLFIILLITAALYVLRTSQPPYLVLLSGAGMTEPVNKIAKDFERQTGIKVQTHFDGSSILRDYIIKFKIGDIFLSGDQKNLDILAKKGLVKRRAFLAWHVVAILASPQAADKISSLNDLGKPGIRLAMSNPKQASLGRLVMEKIINVHPRGQAILHNIKVYGSSSLDVMRLYQQGNIDAVIEWDVMARTPAGKGLIVIPLKKPYQIKSPINAGLLTTARHPKLARRFFQYLITTGRKIFQQDGYNVQKGDT